MAYRYSDIDLVIIGRTGAGKSSTGNSILNRKAFDSIASTTSTTKQIEVEFVDYNSRIIKVVDGPGVGDTDFSERKAYEEITNYMSSALMVTPQGYHAFLIVVRYGGRFTLEDQQTIECLKSVFGKEFVKNVCILVVTCGDNFLYDDTESDSFEDWCSSQTGVFRNLIVECGHRVVLFDNRTKDTDIKNKQLDRLLEIVDGLGSRGRRYTDKYLKTAQRRPDFKQPITHKQSMKEASLILQGLGDFNLDEPNAQLKRLSILLKMADDLLETVTQQDNNTGLLREVIHIARHIKETVEDQMSCTKKTIDIQNRRRYVKEDLERLRQEMDMPRQDELKRMKLKEKIANLKEEEKEHREKIERVAAKMRKDLIAVEKEYVVISEDFKWENFAGTGWFVLNVLNAVFSSWVTYFLKNKKQS